MFLDFDESHCLWQSPDQQIQISLAQLGPYPITYCFLGNRALTLSDLKQLVLSLKFLAQTPKTPLLLLSECPGFEANPDSEVEGLIFWTGQYRSLQQRWKDHQPIISVINHIAVGGSYLAHGLSATHRLTTSDIQFYGTLPPILASKIQSQPIVASSLTEVMAKGLITEIVQHDHLKNRLLELLQIVTV